MKEVLEKIQNEIPESWGKTSLSDRDGSQFLYSFREHGKEVNRRIRAQNDKRFFSIISFGTDSLFDFTNTSTLPVFYSLSFSWYDEKNGSYVLTMPRNVRSIRCPKNVSHKLLGTYDKDEEVFLDSNDNVTDLITLLERKHSNFIRPMQPIRGLATRTCRYISWNVGYPIFLFLIQIARVLIFVFSGKKTEIEKDSSSVVYYLMKEERVSKLTMKEQDSEKIEFFGLNVNLVPLITYSCIHLTTYLVLFFTESIPGFITGIFTNSVLSIMYVVVSLPLLEYVAAKLMLVLAQIGMNIIRVIRNSMVEQFDNPKLLAKMIKSAV